MVAYKIFSVIILNIAILSNCKIRSLSSTFGLSWGGPQDQDFGSNRTLFGPACLRGDFSQKRIFNMRKNVLIALFMGLSSWLMAQMPTQATDISPLLVGESFPALEVNAVDGKRVALEAIWNEKPSVVIFYRGGWCPYCTQHLSAIGQSEAEILNQGYQIIAISPDSPENLSATYDKEGLNYQLFSDADGSLAEAVGIAFQAPEKYADFLSEHSGAKNEGFLPVPAVFVLDQSGKILFEHIDPNYKSRLEAKLLLAVLAAL